MESRTAFFTRPGWVAGLVLVALTFWVGRVQGQVNCDLRCYALDCTVSGAGTYWIYSNSCIAYWQASSGAGTATLPLIPLDKWQATGTTVCPAVGGAWGEADPCMKNPNAPREDISCYSGCVLGS